MTTESNRAGTTAHSYRCPCCRAEYPTEMLARVHVSYATDGVHEDHDGMTPEVEPIECDTDGKPVGTAFTLAGQLNLHGLSLSDIPATYGGRTFDERERRALLVAAFNANRSLSETELRDRVAAHLAGRDLDPLPARDIRALCEHVFGSGTDEATDDTGRSEITPAETRLRDLTPLQQAVVAAHLTHPDRDPTELATRVGTARSYPAQVLEGRSDLVARLRSRLERTSVERLVAERIPEEDLAEIREEGLLETFDIDLAAVREQKRRHRNVAGGSGAPGVAGADNQTTGVNDSPEEGATASNEADRRGEDGTDPVSSGAGGVDAGEDPTEDGVMTTPTADGAETVSRAEVEAVREQVAFDLAVVEQEMELADPTPQQVRTKAYLEQILERLDEILS